MMSIHVYVFVLKPLFEGLEWKMSVKCRLWMFVFALCAWNGLCPAIFNDVDSINRVSEDPLCQSAEQNWEDILLTESEKSARPIDHYPNFTDNPLLTSRMKRLMAPHLLPLDSPLKALCDEIFNRAKIINDIKSLERAGFEILFAQKKSLIIVAKHPKVKGYLFKIYLTSKNVRKYGMVGWELLTTRCVVAKKIKQIIRKEKIRSFVVADKWLYPLPQPSTRRHAKGEPVILVVKDMQIYDRKASTVAWIRNATRKHLRELYAVLGRGYASAFLPGNIPYTKKGKFAYIDTEFDKRKIPLSHVKKFFSPQMMAYWDRLVCGGTESGSGVYLGTGVNVRKVTTILRSDASSQT